MAHATGHAIVSTVSYLQLHEQDEDADRAEDASGGGDQRKPPTPPVVQGAARHDRFEDFLRDEREEERHRDLVHDERQAISGLEVALRRNVRPDERDAAPAGRSRNRSVRNSQTPGRPVRTAGLMTGGSGREAE